MTKPPSWRRRGATPLSEFVADLVAPALARQGLGETGLVADWSEIVGARIGASCRPIEIQWPPRAPRRDPDAPIAPATLVLRVEGAFALETQHSAATIIERVNAHLGWRCIGKIAFRQGPLDATPKRAPKASPPSAQAQALAAGYAAPIEAEDLRAAMTRLGARVIERFGAPKSLDARGVGAISLATQSSVLRPVAKMNGLGNQITVLDLRGAAAGISGEQARAIHATKGLAFDQLMVLFKPRRAGTAAFVRIYNNDGSEAEACGNGTRCVAYLLMREGGWELSLETAAGVLECRREGEFSFRVDMGAPRLEWREIPLRDPVADTRRIDLRIEGVNDAALRMGSAVNMGNPHAIIWVSDIAAHDLASAGPLLEHHPIFPQKANISLGQIVARDHIRLRVWERGVGLTEACGSAACAALVAAVRDNLTERRARVTLPGGDLTIEWREADGRVLMTGPVEMEHETRIAL